MILSKEKYEKYGLYEKNVSLVFFLSVLVLGIYVLLSSMGAFDQITDTLKNTDNGVVALFGVFGGISTLFGQLLAIGIIFIAVIYEAVMIASNRARKDLNSKALYIGLTILFLMLTIPYLYFIISFMLDVRTSIMALICFWASIISFIGLVILKFMTIFSKVE